MGFTHNNQNGPRRALKMGRSVKITKPGLRIPVLCLEYPQSGQGIILGLDRTGRLHCGPYTSCGHTGGLFCFFL